MIGDRVTLNGNIFYVTLHGPMVLGACGDCGVPVGVVGHTARFNDHGLKEDTFSGTPRCTSCARRHYNLGMA